MLRDARLRLTLLAVALAGLASMLGPLLTRDFSPDVWVETQHFQAAESFARDGFLTHRLTPYIQLSPPDETPPPYRVYYTRTQQLSFLFWGWLYDLGLDGVVLWRLLALAMTMAGVLAFYAMLRAGEVPDTVAAAAAVVLAWSPALVTYGHSFVLLYAAMPVLTFGSMALWLRAFQGRAGRGSLVLLWVLLLLQGLATQHTYMMTTQLFFWTYALLQRRWSWSRALVWLTPHVAALALLLAKNAWLLGGIDAAFMDIASKVLWRTANVTLGGQAANIAHPFEWSQFARMVLKHLRWSGGLLALLFWLLAKAFRLPALRSGLLRGTGKLLLALLVPAVVYWIVFFQEAYLHAFHSRNLMAPLSLLAALVGTRVWQLAMTAGRTRKLAVLSIGAALLVAQLAYSHRKAAGDSPWIADARKLASSVSAERDLVLCSFADDYPLSWFLGKPYVFPVVPDRSVNTHSWWLLTNAGEVEKIAATVRSLWPGRSVGLVVRRDYAEADPLLRSIEKRGWEPRWSSGPIAIYVVP